jgi:sigma-E factor negative regulatory protein RseA
MSEANREFLSACMDGELSREEIRFLLRRLEADAGLADVWSRYHAGRDGLRRELTPPASRDFADRVMAAIDAEAVVVSAAPPRRRWLHWSAGGAIAASVAVAALMLSQPAGRHSTNADIAQQAPVAGETALADVTPVTAPVAPQWLSGNNASQFTQKAAFDGSSEGGATYLPRSMPYQIHRARAAETPAPANGYMLLIRPDGSRYVQPVSAPQAR